LIGVIPVIIITIEEAATNTAEEKTTITTTEIEDTKQKFRDLLSKQ